MTPRAANPFVTRLVELVRAQGLIAPHSSSASSNDDALRCLDDTFGFNLTECLEALPSTTARDPLPRAQTAEELISLYEAVSTNDLHSCTLSPQKRHGIVYTPVTVADAIVHSALGAWGSHPNHSVECATVLDPACGAGLFLVRALRALLATRTQLPIEERIEVACTCLHGVDRDPLAVEIAKLSLLLVAHEGQATIASSTPTFRILSGDAIASSVHPNALPLDSNAAPPFIWSQAFEQVRRGGFDIVVGNPPYGLSRDERLSEAENRLLKERFRQFRSGKVNKYLLFMARAYELLNAEGVLSFIVPNAWLGIDGGGPMRELFLRDQSLVSLTNYGARAFPGLGVETVHFVVDRSARASTIELRSMQSEAPAQTVDVRTCRELLNSRIPLFWPDGAATFLQEVRACSAPLGSEHSPLIPYIALQAYATGKGTPPQSTRDVAERIYDRLSPEADTLPYLDGADVSRFAYRWRGKHLRFGPFLAEFPPKARYIGPRVLVREILGAAPHLLQAAVIEEPMLYNRSVLNIVLKSGRDPLFAHALSALLNSRLASAYILLAGNKSQRSLFPKIVNEDLRQFPLPACFTSSAASASLKKLAWLGEELTRAYRGTFNPVRVSALEQDLHLVACESFGVSVAARRFVEMLVPETPVHYDSKEPIVPAA